MNKNMVVWLSVMVFCAGYLSSYAQDQSIEISTQPAEAPPATQPADPLQQELIKARAQQLFDSMAGGDFARAVEHFDETMNKDLPPNVLANKWKGQTKQYGRLTQHTEVSFGKWRKYNVAIVACKFARADFDAEVLFDAQNRIAGLVFTLIYQRPDYDLAGRYIEEEVEFGQAAWVLPGTLTLPLGKGPFPVVVLVHGLGPHDRDETVGTNKPFRDLAAGLASRGIAVFRYVKRNKQYPEKIAVMDMVVGRLTEKGFTIHQEAVEDVKEAVFFLRHKDQIDNNKIFLLGHSYGGTLLPRICTEVWGFKGLIVMGGPSRPLEDVILEQETYLASVDGKVTEEESKK
ncbi:MAG: alpha/beta hydrolase, partial [Planctomycetota bacterium]